MVTRFNPTIIHFQARFACTQCLLHTLKLIGPSLFGTIDCSIGWMNQCCYFCCIHFQGFFFGPNRFILNFSIIVTCVYQPTALVFEGNSSEYTFIYLTITNADFTYSKVCSTPFFFLKRNENDSGQGIPAKIQKYKSEPLLSNRKNLFILICFVRIMNRIEPNRTELITYKPTFLSLLLCLYFVVR